MFKLIAVYYHEKANDESDNVLVHFSENEAEAHSWAVSEYDWKDYDRCWQFVQEHFTFTPIGFVEALNFVLNFKRGYDGK